LRDRPLAEHLFGWNLLGACCGWVLEYTSMAVGYQCLSFIVLVSYNLVFLLLRLDKKKHPALSPVPTASHILSP
jgi:hypothetical protein